MNIKDVFKLGLAVTLFSLVPLGIIVISVIIGSKFGFLWGLLAMPFDCGIGIALLVKILDKFGYL